MQTQLFLCDKAYCDFVVWNQTNVIIERIERDYTLWNEILEKALAFHSRCIMPELVFKYFTKQENFAPESLYTTDTSVCDNTDSFGMISFGAQSTIETDTPIEPDRNEASTTLATTSCDTSSSHVSTDSKSYCYCITGDDGSLMIRCSNRQCKLKWFHHRCIGIKHVPKGIWHCKNCL